MDALRLHGPDAGYAVDRVRIGGNKVVEGVKSVGQEAGGALADERDAERKDEPFQGTLLAGFDGCP